MYSIQSFWYLETLLSLSCALLVSIWITPIVMTVSNKEDTIKRRRENVSYQSSLSIPLLADFFRFNHNNNKKTVNKLQG